MLFQSLASVSFESRKFYDETRIMEEVGRGRVYGEETETSAVTWDSDIGDEDSQLSSELEIEASLSNEQSENPWPHLKEYFDFRDRKDNTLSFHCVLCKPKERVLKAHTTTLQNLRIHIQRCHSQRLQKFLELTKLGSGRGKHRNEMLMFFHYFTPVISGYSNFIFILQIKYQVTVITVMVGTIL